MLWILFAALGAACIACLLQCVRYTEDKLKIKALPVIATVILLLMTVAMGLTAAGKQVVGIGGGDPGAAADRFFSALEAGDFDAAGAYLEYYSDFGLSEAPEDSNTALVYQALIDSYSHNITEKARVRGIYAVQTVELTHLDIDSLYEAMGPAMEKPLQRIVDEKRKADVFDENEQYLPGIVEQAYAEALEAVTANTADCLVTETLELNLVWTLGGWKISVDDALLNALSGFAAY